MAGAGRRERADAFVPHRKPEANLTAAVTAVRGSQRVLHKSVAGVSMFDPLCPLLALAGRLHGR
ncbi:hypothetical protein HDF14_001073 [Edaphobacter lichenicola]|uniref:Uncharacterized protein n=1 Tax=Tunturiibacter gelidiferens TaxID=3069689 RepID=A0A9X0QBW2_9BACT|nr:hypothetical protein [Edaphobacter lichenicola]